MSGDRPPGGTARHEGKPAHRRVQWLDNIRRASFKSERSSHALDEHGLNPEAFKSLTQALERHRSVSPEAVDLTEDGQDPPPPNEPLHIDTNLSKHRKQPSAFSTSTSNTVSAEFTPETISGDASPVDQVPSHLIEEGERAGLPGTADLERFAQKRASQVVRSHTQKGRKSLTAAFRSRKKHLNKSHEPDKRSGHQSEDTDVEKTGFYDPRRYEPQLPPGSGILSALLSLYDNRYPHSGSSTPARSLSPERGRQSKGPRVPGFMAGPSRHRKERNGRAQSKQRSVDISTQHHSEHNVHRDDDDDDDVPPLPINAGVHGKSTILSRRAQAPLSLLGLTDKPPQSRNGGGVLGSLIATTGNIAGAAAPNANVLGPDVERPGYHLSRYSMENIASHRTAAGSHETTPGDHSHVSEGGEPTSNSTPVSPGTYYEGSGNASVKNRLSGYASSIMSGLRSGRSTPADTPGTEHDSYFGKMDEEKKSRRRKKAEVYITRHVAQIIQRQEFLLKMTRAFMMFGAPSHRLPAQIQATANVLDLTVSCMYLPDVVLISFEDPSTGTSQLKFMRQATALDLGKLQDAYNLYWKVIHDLISVSDASVLLDDLMCKKQMYNWWQLMFIGGMCSATICSLSFNGSFMDSVVTFPLGAALVGIQLLSVRNVLYSNVFEITVAMLCSFLAAAIASNSVFCYSAIASSSIVLILPGYLVTCGALEISSRNIVSGSVRLCYAVVYSLFLGFGLAMGASAYEAMAGISILGTDDTSCSMSHYPTAPWYQRKVSLWWAFLTVPGFALFLSMRNFAPWNRKELLLLVIIASIGWVTNHFTSTKFPQQSDITAAVGAFAVGLVANVYARFFKGNAFVIMVTGILFQVPSGLGNGGLLTFVSQQTRGDANSYHSSFQTALQLISVAIGLTVGLGISLVVVHPIQSRKRAAGVFSL